MYWSRRAFELPRRTRRVPPPVAGPPGEPDGRFRKRPQRRPLLFWRQASLTTRVSACHGARRCCHRHELPAGDDVDPGKPGTPPSERAVLGPHPLARPLRLGACGPSPERLCQRTSRSGPREDPSRPQPTRREPYVDVTKPDAHREADTATPTPKHRSGWPAARLELRGARAKRRACYERRDSAVNPGVRCEADTTAEAPKRPDSWTDAGFELRRALTIAASPKDERESTAYERLAA